ncbi:MAG: LPS export ABC transporter periplasmic protein LptC [Candidatus Omnitrophica bacterium]|nr:LPS export ABC transporter periplasmic protein LptC [Candidatus Omnitrophota bacterium]
MLSKRGLIFIFLFVFFAGCAKKEIKSLISPEESLLEESPSSLQKIDNFSLEGFTDKGKKQWELEAKTADVTENLVKMEEVKAIAWGEEGKIDLESKRGEYDKEEKKIHLINNVLIKTSEGTKLTTDELTWDVQKQEANTDKEVVVEREDLVARGKGATALAEMKKVELKEKVEVRAEPKTVITCKGPLEIDYEKNVSKFYEAVEVEDERGKILADRMDVLFNPQERKIEKVFAYGNVKILHGDNVAYADEAVYDAKESKVILKGNPQLVVVP